ncbi:MAG: TIGR04282 family arsenosugar biosynthesis glycosyltransferase [Candidatus Thiodiazotropha sp.]
MQQCAILIFAKTPDPGAVKTRLIPAIGEDAATRLYRGLLLRLVDWTCRQTPYATELWVAPDLGHPLWQQLAAEYGLPVHLQQGDDLGARMGLAVEQALTRHPHVILVGVDCPALAVSHIEQTARWLNEGADAVLGPVEDGGYVLLGLKSYHRRLFQGHRWGGGDVADSTREAFAELDWDWRELPLLWDLDRPGDLQRLQLEYPDLWPF